MVGFDVITEAFAPRSPLRFEKALRSRPVSIRTALTVNGTVSLAPINFFCRTDKRTLALRRMRRVVVEDKLLSRSRYFILVPGGTGACNYCRRKGCVGEKGTGARPICGGGANLSRRLGSCQEGRV